MTVRQLVLVFALVALAVALWTAVAHGEAPTPGYHPDSYPALPDSADSWSGWTNMSATSPSVRSVITASGDSGKRVWITEVGFPSNTASYPAGLNGLTAEPDEVTQVNAFAAANSWVGPVF
jgi:hypothetical protein